MDKRDLLEKVVTTTTLGVDTGILKPRQANRFIDYRFDQSVLMKTARIVRMNAPTVEIEKIDLTNKIMKLATEGTDDGIDKTPTFSKVTMTTVKLRLDWELTTEGLEDNIEGDSLEDHVASMMARQTSNDLEDLFINGDKSLTSDALYKALDGFKTIARGRSTYTGGTALTGTGVIVDAAGANLTRSVFDKALRALPNKYLQRRSQLAFSTSSSLLQDYIWSLSLDASANATYNPGGGAGVTGSGFGAPSPASLLGDAIVNQGMGGGAGGGAGGSYVNGIRPFGIPLLEVPLYSETETGTYTAASGSHGIVELTFPQNRIIGIQRDITVYREFKPKKDTIEYTQFIRVANAVENGASFVHVRNVKVRS
jgi:hypothetical protein